MEATLSVFAASACLVGFMHTAIGIDHTLPFIVIGRARGWSMRKLLGITALCGAGHVAASVVLGGLGILLGISLERLRHWETLRSHWASWLLMGFGLAYVIWALIRYARGRVHTHEHFHRDGTRHEHPHDHRDEHLHIHEREGTVNLTAWTLFLVLVFGPCEPLIPLMMAAYMTFRLPGALLVTGVFSAGTILTMLVLVGLGFQGLRLVQLGKLERYTEILAGAAILATGVVVKFMGL